MNKPRDYFLKMQRIGFLNNKIFGYELFKIGKELTESKQYIGLM